MNNKIMNKIFIISIVSLTSLFLLSFKSSSYLNSSKSDQEIIEFNNQISNAQLTALLSNLNTKFNHNKKVSTVKITKSVEPYLDDLVKEVSIQDKFINFIMENNMREIEPLPYFRDEYYERYKAYFIENPTLTYEDVITHVNIGIDNEFYGKINMINKPNNISVLVNKYHKLTSDFVPNDLVPISATFSWGNQRLVLEARDMFERFAKDALDNGYELIAISTYRSFDDQYNNYYSKINAGRTQDDTDKYNARPGHSEHQLGLAVDVNSLNTSDFAKNSRHYSVYEWYKIRAHKYGFIIRYPKDREHITGYSYEPWHLRYVGVEIATYLYENKLTFDEYIARKTNQ